jgi:predicted aspartyl protease
MTVEVTIDGAGPFRFIVDSGATRTVISRQLAELLGLPDAGRVPLHSVGGESEVNTVRIGALALAGLPPHPVVAPVLEAANLGAAGILGIDALAGKRVMIDIDRNRMTVESAAGRAPSGSGSNEIVVTARRRYGQLVLADADAAGQRIWAIVDTGSMTTLGNTTLRTRLVRRRRASLESNPITDVTGRTIDAFYAPISDIRIAGWHLSNVVVAFSDAHAFERFGLADKPAMLFGMDLMQSFSRISIDFRRRTVRFTRRGAEVPEPRTTIRFRR